jgi:ribosomal protein RSM22 (predicted rRNA methylase)
LSSFDTTGKSGGPRLFTTPPPQALAGLDAYPRVLEQAYPLKAKHKKSLPLDVVRLSEMLTSGRDEFASGYLSRPPDISAYLNYFLPWNLYRLCSLLPNLDLNLADGAAIVDLGAGPLTMAQALWLSRPELRTRRLEFSCLDLSPRILGLGRDMFTALAGPEAPWRFTTHRANVWSAQARGADLVCGAFVLNEPVRSRTTKDERMQRFLDNLVMGQEAAGELLLIEPGTRTGARMISTVREGLLERGWAPQAPCTHAGACPMTGEAKGAWCHFNLTAAKAPRWLVSLSRRSGLDKDSLSLSFLQARPMAGDPAPERQTGEVRVVSGLMRPEGQPPARYGCSGRGLVMLRGRGAVGLVQGQRLTVTWPASPGRDPKSGALIIEEGDGVGS